jgi:hypothetical protein
MTSIFVLEAYTRAEWLEPQFGDAFLSQQRARLPLLPPDLTLTPAVANC